MNRNFRRHRPLFSQPPRREPEKSGRKWVVLPILWLALKRTCMALGVMVLVFAAWGTYLALNMMQPGAPAALPDKMVMYLQFDEAVDELQPEASFTAPFAPSMPTVRELVAALDKAAADKRVQGVLARIDGGGFSLAHVQELRAAVKRFRDSGKFAYVYSPSYGDFGGGFGGYYFASAFEQIWMQPMGVVSITGLNAQVPYFGETLDKIGVETHFFQRKEYKTAYESVTNSEMSAENREMLQALINDMRGEMVTDISADRGMKNVQFERLVDKGLFTADAAGEAGLVTNVDYADVLVENIRTMVTGDPKSEDQVFVTPQQYLGDVKRKRENGESLRSAKAKKSKVALVYAVGAIMPSATGAQAPLGVGRVAAADEIAPAIYEAGEEEDIAAIILRIDSPGGSPTASESILRAIEKAKANGKQVIVSMGPTAASGGYWIAAYADRIFALPTTITGSIGVLGGKISAGEMFDKIGVNWDGVEWGKNSGIWSIHEPYTESEAAQMNLMLDSIYDGFLARVAKGRNMTIDEVDKIAKGRVWSGKRAQEVGLVDELGGLTEALNYTAQQLGGQSKDDLAIFIFPKPKTPLEQFLSLLGESGGVYETLRFNKSAIEALQPVLEPALKDLSVMQNPAQFTTYDPLTIH